MERRAAVGALGAALLGLACFGPAWAEGKADKKEHMHGPFSACARACADCALECDSCHAHCAHLVAEGKKDHVKTMALCNDCGLVCSTAAQITARHGPLAATTCEACARACDACGAACAKFEHDDHMQRCARACKACAKACRDMIKHAGHHDEKES